MNTQLVIVAKPGVRRDAWRALLATLPRIRDIEQVEDAPAALKAVARLRPALVVVDANLLPGETKALFSQIRGLSPETRCIALVETMDRHVITERSAGEITLWQNAPAAEVVAAIERWLIKLPNT